ncbi:hypothetical protein R3P38DRAFT_2765965 [Favolaschia claudopus]|uniref:F-box domain-containing protein n=1 Tax=Favolaschia claudopus TaxID=2862362 RepID=A0AAW0D0D7_9AGAR
MDSLPNEILCRALRAAFVSFTTVDANSAVQREVLRTVCRLWRNAIDGDAHAWASHFITYSTPSDKLEYWLSMSKTVPLLVDMYFPNTLAPLEVQKLPDLFGVLVPFAPRCAQLRVRVANNRIGVYAFGLLAALQMDGLAAVEIIMAPPYQTPRIPTFAHAPPPILTRLSFYHSLPTWGSKGPFASVTSLTLSNLTAFPRPFLSELREFFAAMLFLEHLVLNYVDPHMIGLGQGAQARIILGRLVSLEFAMKRERCLEFLMVLSAPELQRLSLTLDREEDVLPCLQACGRRFSSVVSLKLACRFTSYSVLASGLVDFHAVIYLDGRKSPGFSLAFYGAALATENWCPSLYQVCAGDLPAALAEDILRGHLASSFRSNLVVCANAASDARSPYAEYRLSGDRVGYECRWFWIENQKNMGAERPTDESCRLEPKPDFDQFDAVLTSLLLSSREAIVQSVGERILAEVGIDTASASSESSVAGVPPLAPALGPVATFASHLAPTDERPLPGQLLVVVFAMLARMYHPGSVAFRVLRYTLSRVSPYWHAAVAQTPSLWSTLVVSPSSTSDSIACCLDRTLNRPFHLFLTDYRCYHSVDMRPAVLVQLLRVALSSAGNCTKISLLLRSASTFPIVYEILRRYSFPGLEDLILSAFDPNPSAMVVPPCPALATVTLKHLSLDCVDYLDALTDSFPLLESLRLSSVPFRSWPTASGFIRLLSSCSMLRTLEVERMGLMDEDGGASSCVVFPDALRSLRRLVLHFDNAEAAGATLSLGSFFARFNLRSLVELDVFFASDEEMFEFAASGPSFSSSSLRLGGIITSRSVCVDFFSLCRDVVDLDLGQCLGTAAYEAFGCGGSYQGTLATPVLPALRRIRVRPTDISAVYAGILDRGLRGHTFGSVVLEEGSDADTPFAIDIKDLSSYEDLRSVVDQVSWSVLFDWSVHRTVL